MPIPVEVSTHTDFTSDTDVDIATASIGCTVNTKPVPIKKVSLFAKACKFFYPKTSREDARTSIAHLKRTGEEDTQLRIKIKQQGALIGYQKDIIRLQKARIAELETRIDNLHNNLELSNQITKLRNLAWKHFRLINSHIDHSAGLTRDKITQQVQGLTNQISQPRSNEEVPEPELDNYRFVGTRFSQHRSEHTSEQAHRTKPHKDDLFGSDSSDSEEEEW